MSEYNSNWEAQKAKSSYHFNNDVMDPLYDRVERLGQFVGDWADEIEQVKQTARPATWRNRSRTGKPNPMVAAEENDLLEAGMDPDQVFSHLEYNITPKFQSMADTFGLVGGDYPPQIRVHVQWPGQVFTRHIDKLEKWCPEDPTRVARIMVMLTDWEQGQTNQYGNFTYTNWKAGDIHTFDWINVPHSSANASLEPRVSLLCTGVMTDKTLDFLQQEKREFII